MNNYIGAVIAVVIAIILTTTVVMPTIKGANTTGWSTGEISFYNILSYVVIAGVIFLAGRGLGVWGN